MDSHKESYHSESRFYYPDEENVKFELKGVKFAFNAVS